MEGLEPLDLIQIKLSLIQHRDFQKEEDGVWIRLVGVYILIQRGPVMGEEWIRVGTHSFQKIN